MASQDVMANAHGGNSSVVFERGGLLKKEVEMPVGGVKLCQVSVFKYLGFLLTPVLQFTSHLSQATERAWAAASVTAQHVKRLSVTSFKRFGYYYLGYMELHF
jgi:hypothetical protein